MKKKFSLKNSLTFIGTTFGTAFGATAITAALLSSPAIAGDHHNATYLITITNITKNIQFTPFLATTHRSDVQLFEVGTAASEDLAKIAEGGDISPLKATLEANNRVIDTAASAGLLMPGASVSMEIEAGKYPALNGKLSLVSMLLPTNDNFVALNSVALPNKGTKTYFANAYDAGSELNDESCANIPGPTCGGEGYSVEGGEGYIYPAPGIHGEGDLSSAMYDWDGAVVKVAVKRMY